MENRIKSIMADIFKCDIAQIDENASPDTIENWDSLGQMNLTVALEEEFNVVFSEDEMLNMLNYKLILATLREKDAK